MYQFRKNTELLPKTDRIRNISFSVFTDEEIRNIAVKKITTPLTFDPLGHPIPGGLYDKSLGPINDKGDPCGTCLKYTSECPGHMGYIDLPLPVVNPIFHRLIGSVLKMSCLKCFTVQLPALVKHSLSIQIRLLDRGMVAEALELEKTIFVLAQKYEFQESIPDEATESINYFDILTKEVKDTQDTTSPNITKNTEQLRQQFLNNLNKFLKTMKTCMFCREPRERIKYQKNRVILSSKSNQIHGDGIVRENVMKYVNPDESRNFIREIWKNERDLLMILAPVLDRVKDMENPTDIFYFEILPVPPPHTRPANWVKGKITEHSKTNAYRAVLQNSIILNTIIYVMKHEGEEMDEISIEAKAVYASTKGESAVEKLSNVWEELQVNIDDILNKDTSKQNEFLGLKQVLEKKQGMLRMHMMGKRVNFSARSVITPDPNLKIDEVGIPDTFAKQLTYPTYVNSHNVEALRKMVMNGPNVHPGAVWVQLQSGKMMRLDPNNASQREGIAKQLLTPDEVKNQDYSIQKVVHRHLCNGDILLLNRQPSLHKPSVMAHKARILQKEKTFRLHYANCKAYNADFDGDEMNAHFPQTEKARSEAYSLLNVSNQYLVPKDGTPLSGLIQDHVISGVKLSIRGKFFSKMDYDHLVFQALYHRTRKIKLLRPAIIKPQQLWSGKQVLSTIIINLIPERKALISLNSKSKIKPKDWQNAPSRCWKAGGTMFDNELDMSESQVILRKGELLTGVLDKSHYGATPFGLIHCIYELYGGACATEMLSSLTRLFTIFLQMEGFTLGVQDILTIQKANKKRRKIVKNLRKIGPEVMRKALDLPNDTPVDEIVEKHNIKLAENPNATALVDRSYKSCLDPFTNYINTACLSEGLLSKFPDNNLQLMVISGAKGSTVNTMQMSCCLGQIELEGKRPPVMISGKTLPSFPDFEFSPRAGGFVEGRFLTGIQPQEFFFHCMAGREGLIDTAVKTSRSGYLQRCLVKSLEGVQVKPDLTVRDSDNTIIQFLYGGDGMDVGKAQFLSEKHLPFLHENMDAILDKELLKSESKSERSRKVKQHSKKLKEWRKKHGNTLSKKIINPFTSFTEFFQEHSDRVVTKDQLVQLWTESVEEVKESFLEQCKPCPDTLNSVFLPHSHFGSINERIEGLIDDYEGCNGKKDKKMFANMMKQKAMTALCDSGEAVGLLAAQSIGEPSTQMTLNTFHFAGRGEMNVTLGIPRLREILMMASKNIKTPSMVIPFLPIENLERESEILRKKFNRVTVSDVLKHIEVIVDSDYENRVYKYTLKFVFLPYSQYKDDYCINPKYIIKHMKKKFFKRMFEITREFTKYVEPLLKDTSKAFEKEGDVEDDEDGKASPEVDSSDEEPEDVEDARLERRYLQVHEDQEPESDEMDVSEKEEEEDESSTEKKPDDEDMDFMGKFKVDQEYFSWCQLIFTVPWTDKGKLDLASTLKDIASKSVIWEVPSIKKSITYMKDGILTLRTDGINIAEMSKYENILDLKKLYCNDIHKMIENCGLGAGMAAIVKEIEDVFSVYGIEIDPRHLMLISDFMTSKGSFEPMNRAGMQSSASPFHQMSFESSLKFLADAVIGGKKDVLANPSSSLMTGSLCDVGTGGFDLLDPAC